MAVGQEGRGLKLTSCEKGLRIKRRGFYCSTMVESRLEGNLRPQPSATVSPSDAAAKRAMPRLLGMKRPRSGVGGVGGAGGRLGQKNDSEKPPSNPKGWPDRCKEADLEERPHRRIVVNAEQELWFCNNYVRTSKVRRTHSIPCHRQASLSGADFANIFSLFHDSVSLTPIITTVLLAYAG